MVVNSLCPNAGQETNYLSDLSHESNLNAISDLRKPYRSIPVFKSDIYLYYPSLGIDQQLCHDILITSDGHYDYTTYVDVPSSCTNKPKPSNNKLKPSCIKGREALKRKLSQLHPEYDY